jgi:hypothetical protein
MFQHGDAGGGGEMDAALTVTVVRVRHVNLRHAFVPLHQR